MGEDLKYQEVRSIFDALDRWVGDHLREYADGVARGVVNAMIERPELEKRFSDLGVVVRLDDDDQC